MHPFIHTHTHTHTRKPFMTTSVKDESLCPVWDESGWAYVPRTPTDPTLHIKIMDKDKFGKHDLLGQVHVALNDLKSGKVLETTESLVSFGIQ